MSVSKSERAVLYEALKQSIEPLSDAILKQIDEIYNLSDDQKKECEQDNYFLSDLLDFACTIAYEVETESKIYANS